MTSYACFKSINMLVLIQITTLKNYLTYLQFVATINFLVVEYQDSKM